MGSSHLAQKHVGTFRSRKISKINSFQQRALAIWKEQTKIHQYTNQRWHTLKHL